MYLDQSPLSSTITSSSSTITSSSLSLITTGTSSSSTTSTSSSSSSITFSNCKSIPTDSSQSSISIATCSSVVAVNSPSHHTTQYTSERIKFLLKQQPLIYNVIENEKTNSSLCWKIFGVPAKKSESTDRFERIEGFTSCQSCYQTFAYTSTTGTRNMLAHSCVKNLSNTKITTFTTTSSSSNQLKLDSMMNKYKQVKLNQKEINDVKELACSWICHDMRSFKIIEDNELKDLLQQFITLGILFFLLSYFL
jgi:hypothetical protein